MLDGAIAEAHILELDGSALKSGPADFLQYKNSSINAIQKVGYNQLANTSPRLSLVPFSVKGK
ncbi:unnamed protein product [Gulo gulo]|uniref:Uncharacterized protein n=1 Tax=Gulo gulo TaxID=48420 RepID=A0A9X9M4J9_GULGU|nr:unnamed protein product [Gulo gulo]